MAFADRAGANTRLTLTIKARMIRTAAMKLVLWQPRRFMVIARFTDGTATVAEPANVSYCPYLKNKYLTRAAITRIRTTARIRPKTPMPHIMLGSIISRIN
jgi:hypothetical protein